MSLSAPTNNPLQEQMRQDYGTGLMGAQRELLQQNPSGLGWQEQAIGSELNGYTPRYPRSISPAAVKTSGEIACRVSWLDPTAS